MIASESVVAHDMVSLAWLLESWRTSLHSGKDDFMDTSKVVAGFANRFVVGWLGGWGQALASEAFNKNPLNSIWDDRALNHAYKVFGGVPEIILEASNNIVQADLKNRLSEMTRYKL